MLVTFCQFADFVLPIFAVWTKIAIFAKIFVKDTFIHVYIKWERYYRKEYRAHWPS